MASYQDDEGGGQAPFNMALATLMELRQILKEIRWASTYAIGTPGQTQHTKLKLVRQLFIQATPLLKDKKQSEIAMVAGCTEVAEKPLTLLLPYLNLKPPLLEG